MYIEKLMMIISFTHKLVLAAPHLPGLCWQFQKGFAEPLETFLGTPYRTSIQLVYFQCVRCSRVMCHVAVSCIFLCKAMWSTAHVYYSADAGHSVALKQFSPSSFIQDLVRKETYLLTKTYVIQKIFIAVYRKKRYKNYMNGKFLHMFVNWLYSGIRPLLFLWWTIY